MAAAPSSERRHEGLSLALNDAAADLDRIGRAHGTHLSSLRWDHLRAWQPFLEPFRHRPFDLLELGTGTGASLRTWREWFPGARLIGVDARRVALDPAIPDCTLLQGNQADLALLQHILRSFRPRVVIDDGSRFADERIAAFLTLFPWLVPGAVYLCAGLAEPPGCEEGEQPRALAEWFIALARAQACGGDPPPGEPRAVEIILRHAAGVSFARGSAIVVS